MVDGQYRFDVSRNMVNMSGPALSDFWLVQGPLPTNPKTGNFYSYYTAPASLVPLPLMILSRAFLGVRNAADRFSFSIASAFIGALIGPLLLVFFRRLRIPLKPAIGWTMVFALTTLWWPGSETVLDQTQHGIALLAMTLFAYDAAKGGKWQSALLTGLMGGLLYNYRVPFAALLPAFPIYWIVEARRAGSGRPKPDWAIVAKIALFFVGLGVGLAGYAYYNLVRFGQFDMPVFENGVSMLGNPVAGFLTLMISPGKGLFWFSPPMILAGFGFMAFLKKDRGLTGLIVAVTVLHIGEMSFLSFAGGDWCWGPRYLLPIMPLWALMFPFIAVRATKQVVTVGLIGIGFIVQVMAISLDHHRFFYYRRLTPHFWLDKWAYFRFSQLASRPAEIVESILEHDKDRPKVNSSPNGEATYCPFGPPGQVEPNQAKAPKRPTQGQHRSPLQRLTTAQTAKNILKAASKPRGPAKPPPDPRVWEEQFRIFYLPRPWWGWIDHVPSDQRPLDPKGMLILCCMTTGLGAGMVWKVCAKDADLAGGAADGRD